MNSKNDDVLEVLMEVRDAMAASEQGPDMPELHNFTEHLSNWYDPRRPLATDVWRVLAGLPRKFGKTLDEIEAHAAHGRRYFGGAECSCPVCVKHRQESLGRPELA